MPSTTTTADLRQLISRFDAPCIQFFQGATNLCASRTHFEIVPEHLLLRMLDDTTGDVTQIFNTFKVDRGQIRRAVQRILEEARSGHRAKPALSPKLVEMFQSASVMADEFGFAKIRPGLLILAFVLNPGHMRIGEFTPELERIDVDQLRDHFHEIVLGTSAETAQAEAGAGPPPMAGDGNALAQFTIDLTAKAEGGDIDPVFGRDKEIRQMVDIFSRRRKNNPILVGDPGTGKTAIVEGLALRISKGDVPPVLQGVKLITLDLGLLQAGAGVKGEFENRLKNVINEIRSSATPIITFIDEAHTLIGAGGAAGSGDAANLLKPALARGELRTVAATTWAEYKKYFEKDAALERRFQLVRCDEPSVENTVVMLRGLKEKYEKHHKTIVLDEAIQAAAELSNRYISGRFLPDKAVDLLDTSAARVAIGLTTRPGPLEDLDRRLSHLDTAINAVKRDAASGVAPETDVLEEMLETKESVIAERDALEVKWNGELEAVNHILELRSKLPSFQSDGDDGGDDGQSGADGEGAVKEPATDAKPPVDVDALRKELAEAMKALRESQGDAPLVHPHVDANTVAAVVGDWTGVPVGNMVKDEITAVLEMESRLAKRVVGQDHAVSIIAEKLRTAKSGLGNPQQPMGIFLCVGPSGVGKTEIALAISELLFGGERFTVSINMSEYMEKHTVSQLKGSPPGYIGYGEGGILTEAVRQRPYSVVLLDEIEKAHPEVLNLFYQVFDKGTLADGEGRVVDFKDTVFVLTSNIGTDAIQALCESGEDVTAEDLKEAVYPLLREHLKPALLARMTTIPFLTIGSDVMRMIAKLKVAKVAKRLAKAQNMRLEVDDSVYDKIVEQCDQVDVGARNIDRVLDQKILPVISRRLLEKMTEDTMPTVLTMGTDESGEFTYTFTD